MSQRYVSWCFVDFGWWCFQKRVKMISCGVTSAMIFDWPDSGRLHKRVRTLGDSTRFCGNTKDTDSEIQKLSGIQTTTAVENEDTSREEVYVWRFSKGLNPEIFALSESDESVRCSIQWVENYVCISIECFFVWICTNVSKVPMARSNFQNHHDKK